MENSQTTIELCRLFDLGHKGNYFIWSNKYEDDTFTKERLDRAIANKL